MSLISLVIFICVVLALVIGSLTMPKKNIFAASPSCQVSQIPAVYERLKAEGRDASFAVFMFQPPNAPRAADAINIQFSIEGGRIGLDWCLIAPSNIRDKERFERFVASLGYKLRALEMNQVKYLRAEDGDLPQLCQKVICELYEKKPTSTVDMVVEGFSWP